MSGAVIQLRKAQYVYILSTSSFISVIVALGHTYAIGFLEVL